MGCGVVWCGVGSVLLLWCSEVFSVSPTMVSDLKTYEDVRDQLSRNEPNPGYYVAIKSSNLRQKRQITEDEIDAEGNLVSTHTHTHTHTLNALVTSAY